jgi:glutathione S-transferase
VPSLSYDGQIITESAVVARFLADAYPSHLLPTSTPTENALYRARLDFFVDSFFSKVIPHFWTGVRADSEEERDQAAQTLVDAVAKEIEPLLVSGKGPYYGGSEKLTLAEVGLQTVWTKNAG